MIHGLVKCRPSIGQSSCVQNAGIDLLLCNVMMVCTWLCISNSDDLKVLFIPNREGKVKLFLRNEKSSQKYRKNNNAPNYFEIFNIPTILVVMCMYHSVSDPRYLQEWYFISCFMLSYTGLILLHSNSGLPHELT